MKITLRQDNGKIEKGHLYLVATFLKKAKKNQTPDFSAWDKDLLKSFKAASLNKDYTAQKSETFSFEHQGHKVVALGIGEQKKNNDENLRKQIATFIKKYESKDHAISIDLKSFTLGLETIETAIHAMTEAIVMASYKFDKYKSDQKDSKLQKVTLVNNTTLNLKDAKASLNKGLVLAESVNIARDFVNEPPNVLNSESYTKEVKKLMKGVEGVKVKVMGRKELLKEKMNMFLSVAKASSHDPKLVHLTYTPKKVTKKTKHIALVGKGITFDTGGYSLKPGASMINMKFDMAGSSTVFAAFRAASLLKLNVKISAYMGLTDNVIAPDGTAPDSIVKARNGKTVEILNTDAEGRLVLGDVLTYASEQKPDALIDCATLTGACLMALGTEVCGLMANDQNLADKLLSSAKNTDEYLWQLPIIEEWREDIRSCNADIKNLGTSRWAGTAKAAAFLENFVENDIPWAHLDIAGIGDSQSHLPYCPNKGGSGLIIRTLVNFLENEA
jgi:leucyl aminopeptidase